MTIYEQASNAGIQISGRGMRGSSLHRTLPTFGYSPISTPERIAGQTWPSDAVTNG
jgi:hypothetical protein